MMTKAQGALLLQVPKRRVPVQILLADQRSLKGVFYADVQRLDGTQATLLDRLRDPLERYLPLATPNQHVLVRKSAIITIELPQEELLVPRAAGIQEFRVWVMLAAGPQLTGRLFAALPAHARVLDYLNRTTELFIPLYGEPIPILINTDYIVSVTEQLDTK